MANYLQDVIKAIGSDAVEYSALNYRHPSTEPQQSSAYGILPTSNPIDELTRTGKNNG